jgi:hypothetical protein
MSKASQNRRNYFLLSARLLCSAVAFKYSSRSGVMTAAFIRSRKAVAAFPLIAGVGAIGRAMLSSLRDTTAAKA